MQSIVSPLLKIRCIENSKLDPSLAQTSKIHFLPCMLRLKSEPRSLSMCGK